MALELAESLKNQPGFVVEERPSESPYVAKVWRNESGNVSSFVSIANADWELVFTRQQGRTVVHLRGPETRPTLADTPPDAEFFGVIFKVGTYLPYFPAGALVDSSRELTQAGASAFHFGGRVWDLPTFENVDTFVAALVKEGLIAKDPVVDAVLAGDPPDYSPRTIQSHFRQATGLTHGAVRQILRAQQTLTLLRGGESIQEAVFEAGYFDQAHLTHSLKRFVGQTPAELISAPVPTSIFSTDHMTPLASG